MNETKILKTFPQLKQIFQEIYKLKQEKVVKFVVFYVIVFLNF